MAFAWLKPITTKPHDTSDKIAQRKETKVVVLLPKSDTLKVPA